MKSSLIPQSTDNSSTEKCRSNVISEIVALSCMSRSVTTRVPSNGETDVDRDRRAAERSDFVDRTLFCSKICGD
jgi:hypothetical protein